MKRISMPVSEVAARAAGVWADEALEEKSAGAGVEVPIAAPSTGVELDSERDALVLADADQEARGEAEHDE